MDLLRLPSYTRLAIVSLLLASSYAQDNTTDSDQDSCRIDFDPRAPVNATGSLNIHWSALMMDPSQNDWTLTLTYNETRGSNGTIHRWESYISAPGESEAKACTFMLAALNKTSSSTKREGCDGVIDDACTTVLRETIYLGNDCSWPEPIDEYAERLRQVCGADILSSGMRTYRKCKLQCYLARSTDMLTTILAPVEIGNSTDSCSHSNPPGSSPRDNYQTFQLASQVLDSTNWNSDRNASDFTWYDVHAKQTVPIVVAAEFLGGIAETHVVCVAPNEIAKGSRIPVQRSAASISRQTESAAVAIALALTATMTLV